MANETAWLLERDCPTNWFVEYITVDPSGFFNWDRDPNKALRLARRVDADALASIVEDAERVVEHMWVDKEVMHLEGRSGKLLDPGDASGDNTQPCSAHSNAGGDVGGK